MFIVLPSFIYFPSINTSCNVVTRGKFFLALMLVQKSVEPGRRTEYHLELNQLFYRPGSLSDWQWQYGSVLRAGCCALYQFRQGGCGEVFFFTRGKQNCICSWRVGYFTTAG